MAEPMDDLTLTAHILAGAMARGSCPLVFVTGDGERTTTLGVLVGEAEKAAGALSGPGDRPRRRARSAVAGIL